ncbi:hypothetical protein A3G56_03395 [Candidatus Falkowbacteria bacterium RIFCSPLOWO2_12_FULL_45_10]|uniref:Peptidase C39 domain-containing protein n=1 Tax=Candidatus Falkowbacteria bacterium RIFCSPLOWO2_12_FULL_45_10 TaxID=1797990 RepID=A0A1F5RXH2_9BACT|nr:MAG: hypothetical protein A3G56_03395 [Candidatus Falkowbacteria bacterium RIFCSPLOWO2_12_FULL_45_10]
MKLKIKAFQETLRQSYCGPASLKIILGYYGLAKTEKEIAKLSGWNKELGVNSQGIRRAAQKFGFKVIVKNNSDFADIKKWLEKNTPVIADWFTRGRSDYGDSDIAEGHYSVVCGLDARYVYLQDPEIGRIRKLSREDFKKAWFDFSGKYISRKNLIIRQIIVIYL